MPNVIPRLLEEASRLFGVRLSHVVHSDGDRFDFRAVTDGDETRPCVGTNLPTHMPFGDEPGISGRLDRVLGTVVSISGEDTRHEPAEITSLADVMYALTEWNHRVNLWRGTRMAELALAPVMPEFGEILQISVSGASSWLSTADGQRLDSLLTSLGHRLEARLEAAVHDKAKLASVLRALADDLQEVRSLLRKQGCKDWIQSFAERIGPWIKAAHGPHRHGGART